jgi:hypothetical protein
MRPHTLRGLGFALLAMAGAALLGLTSMTSAIASADDVEIVLGGTGPCCVTASTLDGGIPGPPYTTVAEQLFTAPYFPVTSVEGLGTPEQLAPFTGINSLPLEQSVSEDVTDLSNAVTSELAQGNDVVVFGYSQSATAATVYEDELAALPAAERPSPDQLSFVLIGDPDNPDGGFFERVPGVDIPSLGIDTSSFGPTPDDLYPTIVYTAQYDGFADFPQYPLDILADLNAILGIVYAHGVYGFLTAAQIATGVVEPVTSADTDTTYIMIPAQTLPLLEPLEGIVPAPLLDLIEAPLQYIINLGYDPTAPANVAAPAQLFPDINSIAASIGFVQSIGQGVNDALAAEGLPPLNLPAVTDLLNDLANSPLATTTFAAPDLTIAVPPQLADAVDGPLNSLNSLLDNAIDDELDPAIQSTVYGLGSALTTAATQVGAPAGIANAIYALEQVLPIDLEEPGLFVTVTAQDLVNAVEDLAAGNVSGFGQELQSTGADDIIVGGFGGFTVLYALDAIVTGASPTL